jgi:hypothetical protein
MYLMLARKYSLMQKGMDFIGVGVGALIFNEKGSMRKARFSCQKGVPRQRTRGVNGTFPGAVSNSEKGWRMP